MTDPSGRSHALADDERYAPYDVTSDATALGLVSTAVRSAVGTCVARHRRSRGSDRATLFLHGAAGAWTTWTPVLKAADAARLVIRDPVLLDLPGWGDAELTGDRAAITIDAIAELVRTTMDELGYPEWDVVGHSLGGFVGMHLATTHPDRVASVSMVSGTTFSVIRSVEHPVRRFGELPMFTMLWRVMQVLTRLGSVGTGLVRAAGAVGVLRLVFAPLFRHGTRMPRSLITATARDLRPRAFAAAAGVVRGYDASGRWSGIRCPVIAVKGDRDVFVTDDDLVHLARVLPESTRVVIGDCGHFANVERPAALIRALGWAGPS